MSAIGPPSRPLDYYKWYWRDWRANRKVQRMSYVERGIYRELLDECWAEGSIPASIEELAEICGCSKEVMAEAWQVLSNCFTPIENRFINDKIESLRTEKDRERLAKSSAGRKGGISKSTGRRGSKATVKQDLASAKQLPEDAKLLSYRREEKRREDIYGQEGPISGLKKPQPKAAVLDGFDEFWSRYPRKVSKSEAMKAWAKLKPDEDLRDRIASAIAKQKESTGWTKDEGRFIPHASTWLNQRRWEDEVESTGFDWDEALRGAA